MEPLSLILFTVVVVISFVVVIIALKYFTTWLRAKVASAPVSIGKMIGMSLRKVPVGLIVDNRITAVKAGIENFLKVTQADELMVTGHIYDHRARLWSFEIAAGILKDFVKS